MNLSSSTRAAVAITEAVYNQNPWLTNWATLSFEINAKTGKQQLLPPGHKPWLYREFDVTVKNDGWAVTSMEITLYGKDLIDNVSWKRADITLYVMGTMYRSYHYKAVWTPKGWNARQVCLIASSHGYGAMEYDSGFLLDPLPSSMKKVTPTPQPA